MDRYAFLAMTFMVEISSLRGLLRHIVSRNDGWVGGSALDRHALLAMT